MKTTAILTTALISSGVICSSASAQQLSVPVMEYTAEDLDTCSYGKVFGLKKDGDGFLAVRSGPSTNHDKLDEIHNGDEVWLFDFQKPWIGIVYGVETVSCSPIDADRIVQHDGKKGWVHENWIEFLAG